MFFIRVIRVIRGQEKNKKSGHRSPTLPWPETNVLEESGYTARNGPGLVNDPVVQFL